MPYIKQERRPEIDQALAPLLYILEHGINRPAEGVIFATADKHKLTSGDINYIETKMAKAYCKRYEDYNAFYGACDLSKLEVYRRWLGPYEQRAIKKNGDL